MTIKTATVLNVVGILLVLVFLWMVREILLLLAVALFLAGLMHPAARWGARHRIPKGVTVTFIYILLFSLLATSLALIIPTVMQQAGSIAGVLGFQEVFDQVARNISAMVSSGAKNFRSLIGQDGVTAASGFFTVLTDIFGGLAGLAAVLVMAFYMVVQDQEAVRVFKNFVPDAYQEVSAQIILRVEEKIGRWLSGQLVLSLIIGVLYYIGLLVLGIDSALALALFAAFTEFIPYLGPILGGIPIVIVAFSVSPIKALFALALVIIIQQLENQIIVPKVMQRAVGLNPLVSILAVLIGAKLFGILGVLLSIPLATAVSVALSELYRFKQKEIPPTA